MSYSVFGQGLVRYNPTTNGAVANATLADGHVLTYMNPPGIWTNKVLTASATNAQPASPVLTNLVNTVARNVTNVVSLSTTNATSKPLTNSYTAGVLTLFGLEQGSGTALSVNGSNIVTALDWAQVASTTNVVGVSNWVNSVSNLVQTKQVGSAVLTNLVNTVANNVTNIISLSTSNATSKPLSNYYTAGVLTLFGLEAGANTTITPNGSNLVVASTGGGSGGTNYPASVNNGVNGTITVDPGHAQHVTISSNGSFQGTISGATASGHRITLTLVNTNLGSNLYYTNSTAFYNPHVRSNETTLLVVSNSTRIVTLVSNSATGRWQMETDAQQLPELRFGGFTRTSTNSDASVVTAYHGYTVDYIDAVAMDTNATNVAATYRRADTNQISIPRVYWEFGTSASNQVFFKMSAPTDWDGGSVKAKFQWFGTNAASLATNVWELSAGRWVDNTNTFVWGTAQIIRQADDPGDEEQTTAATPALTIANTPLPDWPVVFRVRRLPDHADDTMPGIATLRAVMLQWGLTNGVVSAW